MSYKTTNVKIRLSWMHDLSERQRELHVRFPRRQNKT